MERRSDWCPIEAGCNYKIEGVCCHSVGKRLIGATPISPEDLETLKIFGVPCAKHLTDKHQIQQTQSPLNL